MPSLTDGEIRRALKQVEQSGKQLSLVDGEGHGTGRLVLVMKPMPTRVTADWMAQQWRDQKRLKKKLGSYPSMALSKACQRPAEPASADAPAHATSAGKHGPVCSDPNFRN